MEDTGHILFDAHGCGPTHRTLLDEQIKSGERSFRDVSEEMWGSLNVPFDDGFSVMRETLSIDPDFRTFHDYCIANSIPFNVISAGLKPILRRVLDEFLGEEQARHIDIVANEAEISESGESWKPIWRHDTELGHDKALSITEARAQANLEADVLFARRGLRLEEYCIENKIPYLGFDTFADIKKEIEKLREEDEKATQGRGVPKRFNPRANMWRRVSSQRAVPLLVAQTPSKEE